MRISVPPHGPPNAKIALVGEQPGKYEVIKREPFVGPSGRELSDCLHQVALARSSLYFTNVIKNLDHPLSHFIVKADRKSPYWTAEGQECVQFLASELQNMKLNAVGAIGNVALFALADRWGITKWRGSVIESTLVPGLKVVPMIHPATIIPPKGVYTNKLLLTHDLMTLAIQGEFPQIVRAQRNLIINPTLDQIHQTLAMLWSCPIIDFDIEIDRGTKQVTCIAFAWDEHNAISIPFVGDKGDIWTPEQEAQIWASIATVLENPRTAKRGQNLVFDSHVLLRHYGIRVSGEIHDTMLMQRISAPDYPAGLDFICSIHTDIPYYKEEGKAWLRKDIIGWSPMKFWTYNATDAVATAAATPSLMKDLKGEGNIETYDRQRRLIPILVYMMERGIKVDVKGMEEERKRAQTEIDEKLARLHELAGRAINPNSPKQLIDYFYLEKGHAPYLKRTDKGSRPTVDDDAMKRLARKGVEEARLIQDLRYLTTKVLGTYLDPEKVSKDGRYRAAYNPGGARTGRLSSSTNLFGEGGNKQNWPHELLRFLRADDGYVYYGIDLSQAENRIVAYVGRVLNMIQAFEEGRDVHCLTGAMISGKTPEEVKAEDVAGIGSPIGDGKKTWRYWGKRSNHALNYGLGYRKFALDCEIPEGQSKWLVERYHQVFPEVRSTYHMLLKQMLKTDRIVTNLMGRRRLFLGQLDDDTYKEAYAQIPQSTVADVINERGLEFMYYDQSTFWGVEILEQVHDSIGFQIPVSAGWEYHAMVLTKLKRSLETELHWRGRSFSIPADIVMGLTLEKEVGIEFKHSKWPSDVAAALEDGYAKLCDRATSQRQ